VFTKDVWMYTQLKDGKTAIAIVTDAKELFQFSN
jgi:hypothetical protein